MDELKTPNEWANTTGNVQNVAVKEIPLTPRRI